MTVFHFLCQGHTQALRGTSLVFAFILPWCLRQGRPRCRRTWDHGVLCARCCPAIPAFVSLSPGWNFPLLS